MAPAPSRMETTLWLESGSVLAPSPPGWRFWVLATADTPPASAAAEIPPPPPPPPAAAAAAADLSESAAGSGEANKLDANRSRASGKFHRGQRGTHVPIAIAAAIEIVLALVGGLAFHFRAGSQSEATVHIPARYVSGFTQGTQNGKYVFYALANKVPAWDSVAKTGIFICSTSRPPLIPQELLGPLSSIQTSGTSVTLSTSDVKAALGVDHLIVTVPPAIDGCTTAALSEMKATPGTLLMVDANAKFAEQSQLIMVKLE